MSKYSNKRVGQSWNLSEADFFFQLMSRLASGRDVTAMKRHPAFASVGKKACTMNARAIVIKAEQDEQVQGQ